MFLDYCAERQADITNMTAKKLFQLQGQNSHMSTFGDQGGISNICQFCWYEWVYTRYISEPLPHMAEVIGICLGPSNNEGKKMTQWVLNINGQVVPWRYLFRCDLINLTVMLKFQNKLLLMCKSK